MLIQHNKQYMQLRDASNKYDELKVLCEYFKDKISGKGWKESGSLRDFLREFRNTFCDDSGMDWMEDETQLHRLIDAVLKG